MFLTLLIVSFRHKEDLITTAQAHGKTMDEALASADDAIARDHLANIDAAIAEDGDARAELRMIQDLETSVEAGFQLAAFQGPLCGEPVVGMAWNVVDLKLNKTDDEQREPFKHYHTSAQVAVRGRGSAVVGALISAVRDACRQGMLDWSPRMKLAMYTCDIQASSTSRHLRLASRSLTRS